jgi:hypothetical protein
VGDPLALILFLFGVGFLAANLLILADLIRYRRRAPRAVLTWRLPWPRPAVLPKAIAVGLGGLLFYKLVILGWPGSAVFGEGMMFLYYAIWYPISFTIERGFYQEGIWLERGFVRYRDITGVTWREEPEPTLIAVAGRRQRAGHLHVPIEHFAEARRILRDRIRADQMHLPAPLLDLGGHDRREDV